MLSRFPAWLLIPIAATFPCFGREIFQLSSGFSLEARSHTQIQDRLVLTTSTGTVELLVADVLKIETVPDPVPPSDRAVSVVKRPQDPGELVRWAAASQGDAPEFIRFVQSVARVESELKEHAVSSKGAVGLMQLMPKTAEDLGVSASDPRQNAEGGAKYLRQLLQLYKNDSVLALAAYNAGPGAVQRYGGIPPYSETWQYVRRVLRDYAKAGALNGAASPSSPSATK